MANVEFPRNYLYQTPATIRVAFEAESKGIKEESNMGGMNISSILTNIIQETGRFAERLASDVLCDIDTIRLLCENAYPLEEDIDEVLGLGIRRDGVDGNNFLLSRLAGSVCGPMSGYVFPEHIYRKILAVRVRVSAERSEDGFILGKPWVVCELKDISSRFLHLDAADFDAEGHLLLPRYKNGNPKPQKRPISR